MGRPIIIIAGQEVTGIQAEVAFMQWALALEQEHNQALITACKGNRCGLAVCEVFQKAVFGKNIAFMGLLGQAGITVIATDYSPGLGYGYLTKLGFFGGYDTEAEALNMGMLAQQRIQEAAA
ncbi:hypothetical protein B9Z51_08795 [Limnohabitans sp. T6-5]|uniref:hypothetical protein n=1 Tax=Limnohabitans sp. T6-5 TaxID=1100724 RepID=UPI000D39F20E|nr:hypothetical protein [Limnohabitans sp. T6-5]PUE09018.1 hypothetical protein B9Z51_08795 [Limnohabitans sp. T6-5]